MRPLRSNDPRRLGRYRLVGCLSETTDGIPTPERMYVALTPDGHRTVLVATPLPEHAADPGYAPRFQREAIDEQRLSAMSPCLSDISDVSVPGEHPPWRAWPYVPCLPLPEALAVNGGALPERSVRAIGAALAESVAELHGQGVAHAGILPRSVLIAGDRPRLTGYGAVRAAGPDGQSRAALPGLPAQSISPEQLAGGRPRPLGDVYALGSVLSYAATGNPAAGPEELPAGLERLISGCLSHDPADRPQLPEMLTRLTEPATSPAWGQTGPAGFSPAAPGTEVDAKASRAAVLLVPGWLPRRLSAALGTEAADVLAAETEEQLDLAQPETPGETADASAGSTTVTGDDGAEQGQDDRWSFARAIPRRTVVTAAACGAAGLAVGGGATWAITDRPTPTAAQRLVASRKSKKRVGGTPPTPRWRYQIPGAAPRFAPLVCGHVVVFVSESAACGVDVRSGRQVWHAPTARASREPWKTDDGRLVLVPGKELAAVDAHTGRIRWRYERSHERGPLPHPAVLAVDGTSLWCTTKYGSGSDTGTEGSRTVVAYDMTKQAEVWRQQVPVEFSEGHLLGDVLLLTTSSPPNTKSAKDKGKPRRFVALDRRTGKQHAKRSFDGVTTAQLVTSAGGQLIVAAGDRLRGYDVQHDGKVRWTVQTRGKNERERPPFGPPLVHGKTVYASDAQYGMQAVDLPDGHVRWQSVTEALLGGWNRLPRTSVTPSGHRLTTVNDAEVDAFDADNGSLLWRFLDLPGKGRMTKGRRMVALTDHLAVVLSHGTAYALPLD